MLWRPRELLHGRRKNPTTRVNSELWAGGSVSWVKWCATLVAMKRSTCNRECVSRTKRELLQRRRKISVTRVHGQLDRRPCLLLSAATSAGSKPTYLNAIWIQNSTTEVGDNVTSSQNTPEAEVKSKNSSSCLEAGVMGRHCKPGSSHD